MVDQLIAIDQRQITNVETTQKKIETKRSSWQEINSLLTSLKSSVSLLRDSDAFQKFSASLSSSSSTSAQNILAVTLNEKANAGGFDVQVLQRASSEKLSSASFSAMDESLGLSGEFLLGGQLISVSATDSLISIRDKMNQANSGSSASGVSASILTSGPDAYRLVLTASQTGADGIDLLDASSTNIVQSLGFVDSTTSLKTVTSNGALSDGFASADTSITSLRGLSADLSSAQVRIGAYTNLTIDLSDSLTEIRDSLNSQAGATIASIVTEEDDDGSTLYKLKLIGTTISSPDNVLQALGVLEAGHSNVAEVQKSSALAQTSAAGGGAITAATSFSQINTGSDASSVVAGDTISISGKDHAGNTITGTFTISDPAVDTMDDLLTRIETLFGANGHSVSASIDGDGKLTVTDDTSGESLLAVSLVANNEGGGDLDFGDVSMTTEGRSMQIQQGLNAKFIVDGVQLEQASNTVNNVVAGASFDLLKAEVGTTVSVSVSRDKAAIRNAVNDFIGKYNSVVSWISTQMSYDQEKKVAGGPLFGDSTLSGLSNSLMNSIIGRISGTSTSTSTLALLGIKLQEDGTLALNQSTFDGLVDSDFQNLVNFFAAQGSSSTGSLQYINYARATQEGTYDVAITAAAAQASVTGSSNLNDGDGLDGDDTLTITDKSSGQVAIVSLTAGMNLNDTILAINSELNRTYTQILTEASGHTLTSAAGGGSMSASTTWDQLNTGGDANDLSDDESINFSLTLRGGRTVTGSYLISDVTSDNVGDLLEAIESASGDTVSARIDNSGRIVVTDNDTGKSSLALSLSYSGAGSLSFDTMDTTTTGRYAMNISAADGGSGKLSLIHNDYGSAQGFTLAQSSNHLGLADAESVGVDVAGTINGEAATGKGQSLTGNSGENNIDGLVIRYTGSSTGSIGTVTFSKGFAESLERTLYGYTDPYTGFVDSKRDGLQLSIDSLTEQIERMTTRLDMKREMLINQFVGMEKAMSAIQNQGNWLSAQLGNM
jgi:flagellar hook-associated protein 2